MSTCPQELCRHWTGDGCACALLGLNPDVETTDMSGLDEFTEDPTWACPPLTFEEITWACPNCGWTSALCTEHRAMAEEIRAEQDEDARRDES